jgi:hypothetical protein
MVVHLGRYVRGQVRVDGLQPLVLRLRQGEQARAFGNERRALGIDNVQPLRVQ